jgi:hypothetical protein
MATYYLPRKLPAYLLRLDREYARNGDALQQEIVQSCRAAVTENTDFDNYNSGSTGHDARLYIPMEVHERIPLKQLDKVADAICSDLNQLCRQVPNEYFRAVILEVDDENDPDYQRAIPFSAKPPLNPDTLSFWKPGQIRLFITHRDEDKVGANALADALSMYGISSFVAHDTIKPMKEWRREILKGLETMEMMLVYLTDKFADSIWTQQEVGYALGKGIPVISLKMQRKDPPGFIDNVQAQRGSMEDPANSAASIYRLISDELGAKERLNDGLVAAFVASEDYYDARYRFDRMAANVEKLTEAQLRSIIRGYHDNPQLYEAIYLNNQYNRLANYLQRATGAAYSISGREIRAPEPASDLEDEVPF